MKSFPLSVLGLFITIGICQQAIAQDTPPTVIESITVSRGDSTLLKKMQLECKTKLLNQLGREAKKSGSHSYSVIKSLIFTSEDDRYVNDDMQKILEFTYVAIKSDSRKPRKIAASLSGKGVARYVTKDGDNYKFLQIDLVASTH